MTSPPTTTTSSNNTNTRAQMAQTARDQQQHASKADGPSTSPTDRISQEKSLFLSDLDGGMAAVVVSTPPSRKKPGGFELGEASEGKMEVQQQGEGEEGGDGDDWMPVTPKGRRSRLVSKSGSQPSTPEGRENRVSMSAKGSQPNTPEGRKSLVSRTGGEPTTPESKGKGRLTTQTDKDAGAVKSPPPSPWSPGRTYAQVLMGGSPARVDLEKAKERAQGMAVLFGGGRGVVAEPVIGKGGEEGGEKEGGEKEGGNVVKEENGREEVRSDSVETVIIVDKEDSTIGAGGDDGEEKENSEESSADASGKQGQEEEREQKQAQQTFDPPNASTTAYRISTTTEQEQPVLDLNARPANAGDADDDNKSVASDQSSVFSDEEKDENQVQSGETATGEKVSGLVEVEVSEEEIKLQDIQGVDPRLFTYCSLHNEMMVDQTTHSTNPTLLLQAATRAQNIARHLLTSHAKNADVPLVMRAHSCLILGCSDSDDCFERMQEAVALIRQAGEEGAIERAQAEHMLEVCGSVMSVMRGEEGGKLEGTGGGKGEDGDGSEESEGEGEEGGEGYRLP